MGGRSGKQPVTVVTGFLGSGKTTVLSKLLKTAAMKRAAVIVNEVGKVSLDHHLLHQVEEHMLVLSGGCACCSVRSDLADALRYFLDIQEKAVTDFERVVIETSGLADPAPIAFTILSDPVLQHHFYVDGIVTVVDAVNAENQLNSQPESVKQIVVADKLIIAKTDLVSVEKLERLRQQLQVLNPGADVTTAVYGGVDPDFVFGRSRVLESASAMAHTALFREAVDHQHRSDLYSISLTFDQPLNWTAFTVWLSMLLHAHGESILRVKGLLDVGESGAVALHGVQHIIHPPEHLPGWPEGKRTSRLVFIARGIDPGTILRSLEAFQRLLGATPRFAEVHVGAAG